MDEEQFYQGLRQMALDKKPRVLFFEAWSLPELSAICNDAFFLGLFCLRITDETGPFFRSWTLAVCNNSAKDLLSQHGKYFFDGNDLSYKMKKEALVNEKKDNTIPI